MSKLEVLLALKQQLSSAFSSYILNNQFQFSLQELSRRYLKEFDIAMAGTYKKMAAE